MENYTMSELAHLLGVSKDVIKYHRKKLPEEVISKNEHGMVVISEEGVEIIRGKLRNKDYSAEFKKTTLRHLEAIRGEFDPSAQLFRSLSAIEEALGINSSVVKVSLEDLVKLRQPKTGRTPEKSLLDQLDELIEDEDFQNWYRKKKWYSKWDPFLAEMIKLVDVREYFEQKQL